MYLYQATRDEWYLSIAERALRDLNSRARVACGFAAIKDLRTGELEDKMPSFVTGETLKYLFLTFAEVRAPETCSATRERQRRRLADARGARCRTRPS